MEDLELSELTRDTRVWLDRPVLVTGATGLQGSCLTRLLHGLQADIVVLLRDWVPQAELCRSSLLEQVKVVRGDVRDQALLERVLGEYEIITVFHLAAQTIVPIANRNPLSTFESNIQGTWTLLEACRRSPQVKQIVVASSDKAYGDQTALPYREHLPLNGQHPYDVSKSCADLLAQAYAKTYRLPVAIARCGNLYGGGDLNWNRLIPGTIRSVLREEPPVIRSDGTLTRDYFYVEDGARAYLQLAERLATDGSLGGEAFNFSNEQPASVLEVVTQILALMGRERVKPVIRNEASHEIPHQYLDASKAKTRLAWQAQFSLEEGLRRTIAWYQDFFQTRPIDA
ncbi:MAG: GDP-mannose 4,6-dehydratase [Candidatus Omnitrophica bacterium]|nr:GDP-mannose 4,6-dehydratase [Candidatus Omnitrophota bacterium]